MESNTRHFSSFKLLKTTTWCLLVVVTLQLVALTQCQSSQSGFDLPCIPDCKEGETCTTKEDGSSVCEQKNCNFNCTDEESEVCGSDGATYPNRCKLEMKNCEMDTEVYVKHSSECITLAPPPEPLCKIHQDAYDKADLSQRCNFQEIYQSNDLQLSDVLDCYRPQCVENQYKSRQCVGRWCWCSSSDGLAINGTLQKNMKADTCDKRAMCHMEDQSYKDGETFSHPSGCGLCECLDGETICYENYVPQPNGTLTEDQLTLLKDEVLKVFLIQYNHKEHVLVDIRFIHQYPTQVTGSLKSKILRWKFDHYDRNRDGILSDAEEFLFQGELFDFVKCKSFFEHVSDVMDVTNDVQISRQEWTTFFAEELAIEFTSGSTSGLEGSSLLTAQSKRSINGGLMPLGRKPLNLRKKFYYTFF